jgi:hypothetical protein
MPDEVGVMRSKMVFYFSKCPASCGEKEFHLVNNPPNYTCKFLLGLEVVCFVEHVKDVPWCYGTLP